MNRLYLMPITGDGLTKATPRKPKYASLMSVWSMMDYGFRPTCLVASDTDQATHDDLILNADVFAFPDAFESSGVEVGNQSNNVTNTLEAFAIPAQWVANQSTYASVAHTVGAMFQYMQRLNGILGNVDPFVGATMSTKIADLAPATGQAMFDAGASFGWDMSGVSNQTSLRNFIKYMADQWAAKPLLLGGFSF